MRVFVTGASGWIGSAVVPELLGAGHEVVGLARSDASASALSSAGAKVHRGSLADPESLRTGAAESDAVIHLAFIHDFADYVAAAAADRQAIETLGAALSGSGRPLVIASGLAGLADGRVATEQDMPDLAGIGGGRGVSAQVALAQAEHGVRPVVLRLPPTVHGDGDHGFMATLVGIARERGVAGYLGDGANCWAAVHRSDAARLFRLAVEQPPASAILHAVGDEGIPTREIAAVIGRHLGVPVSPVADPAHFSWLGGFFGMDARASSAHTQELMGWQPTGPGLIEDLEMGHYFRKG